MTYKIDLEITFRPIASNEGDILTLDLNYEYLDDLDDLPDLIRKRIKEMIDIGDL